MDKSDWSCGVMIASILVINAVFGGMSVNYLLDVFMGKVLPLGWAIVIGLFVGEFSIPAAVILWILKHFQIIG